MAINAEFLTSQDLAHLSAKIDALHESVNSLVSKEYGKKFFKNKELAEALHVDIRTLQNWRNEGIIEFSQIGSIIIYSEKNVEDFLAKHLVRGKVTFENKGRLHAVVA